jgi:putative NIF3 family GTP cyclohydrolase 1 type 2
MKAMDIYKYIIEMGIKADPRGRKEMARILKENKQKYEDLKDDEKWEFDMDALFNPYEDSRLLFDSGKDIKRILTGIDVDTGEVVLADRLTEKGKRIDLILAHHPSGRAGAGFWGVMHMQADILNQLGIPINVAEGMLADRISEVSRAVAPGNHNKAVDSAGHLGISFMCCHTPADNNVDLFLQNLMDRKRPRTIGDVVKLLKEVPEYREAVKLKAGPRIIVGSKDGRAGKVVLDMTGGTSGAKEVYEKLAEVGVGTIIMMHIREDHITEAKKHHINVIVAGHMASDSIGMNHVLDGLEKKGIEIVPFAGLIRVSRNKGGKKKR